MIEQHPIRSQELATFTDDLQGVGLVIRAHHERWDGQGYPDRLQAKAIPWLASLLAVSVSYANTNLEPAARLEWIERGSGSLFDPAAVRALRQSLAPK